MLLDKSKIYDCITFYDENLLVNARFEILDDVVDYFIICESKYDHRGKAKSINFFLKNKKFQNKIRHIVLEENFPNLQDPWEIESYQREMIFKGLYDSDPRDLIMYSDSDEIPNPEILKNYSLNKKFGIFMMKSYVYKINIFNQYESPWEGTRICQKKFLKSFTYLRKKIKKKNIAKPFWNIFLEKDISIISNGGWHFNNLYTPEVISKKLRTFPHREFSGKEFSDINLIKKKIDNLEDLFYRGHLYLKVQIDNGYPEFILNNLSQFKSFIQL
jgi:beta-1,4-mannosyl-glycoprotein beta-1,4-N-acetylglucosaminyltransferase